MSHGPYAVSLYGFNLDEHAGVSKETLELLNDLLSLSQQDELGTVPTELAALDTELHNPLEALYKWNRKWATENIPFIKEFLKLKGTLCRVPEESYPEECESGQILLGVSLDRLINKRVSKAICVEAAFFGWIEYI